MFPLIFQSLYANKSSFVQHFTWTPWIWNDVYEICAKSFLEEHLCRSKFYYVRSSHNLCAHAHMHGLERRLNNTALCDVLRPAYGLDVLSLRLRRWLQWKRRSWGIGRWCHCAKLPFCIRQPTWKSTLFRWSDVWLEVTGSPHAHPLAVFSASPTLKSRERSKQNSDSKSHAA